jgi:hypothetical protein
MVREKVDGTVGIPYTVQYRYYMYTVQYMYGSEDTGNQWAYHGQQEPSSDT